MAADLHKVSKTFNVAEGKSGIKENIYGGFYSRLRTVDRQNWTAKNKTESLFGLRRLEENYIWLGQQNGEDIFQRTSKTSFNGFRTKTTEYHPLNGKKSEHRRHLGGLYESGAEYGTDGRILSTSWSDPVGTVRVSKTADGRRVIHEQKDFGGWHSSRKEALMLPNGKTVKWRTMERQTGSYSMKVSLDPNGKGETKTRSFGSVFGKGWLFKHSVHYNFETQRKTIEYSGLFNIRRRTKERPITGKEMEKFYMRSGNAEAVDNAWRERAADMAGSQRDSIPGGTRSVLSAANLRELGSSTVVDRATLENRFSLDEAPVRGTNRPSGADVASREAVVDLASSEPGFQTRADAGPPRRYGVSTPDVEDRGSYVNTSRTPSRLSSHYSETPSLYAAAFSPGMPSDNKELLLNETGSLTLSVAEDHPGGFNAELSYPSGLSDRSSETSGSSYSQTSTPGSLSGHSDMSGLSDHDAMEQSVYSESRPESAASFRTGAVSTTSKDAIVQKAMRDLRESLSQTSQLTGSSAPDRGFAGPGQRAGNEGTLQSRSGDPSLHDAVDATAGAGPTWQPGRSSETSASIYSQASAPDASSGYSVMSGQLDHDTVAQSVSPGRRPGSAAPFRSDVRSPTSEDAAVQKALQELKVSLNHTSQHTGPSASSRGLVVPGRRALNTNVLQSRNGGPSSRDVSDTAAQNATREYGVKRPATSTRGKDGAYQPPEGYSPEKLRRDLNTRPDLLHKPSLKEINFERPTLDDRSEDRSGRAVIGRG